MFKILAALLMLIDHICFIFEPLFPPVVTLIGRSLGRLSFPMFAYALARGYNRSKNVFYYFLRISFFAVITQILFTMFTRYYNLGDYLYQNVLITFALAMAIMSGMDFLERSSLDMIIMMRPVLSEGEMNKRMNPGGIRLPAWIGTLIGIFLIGGAIFLTAKLNPDYGFFGLITVVTFQRIDRNEEDYKKTLRKDLRRRRMLLFLGSYTLINLVYTAGNLRFFAYTGFKDFIQLFSILAVFLFPLYEREKKPGAFGKYFFYVFYPAHYCLLLLIRHLISRV